jgi:plastocyanin
MAGLVGLALIAFAAWGCGETGDADPTPVRTFKITPAANATVTSVATEPAGSPTAPAVTTPTAVPGTPGAGTTIEIAGISNEFDVEEVTAPAGPITVIFDNRDGGVLHNIHFFAGDDADGEDVGETELEVGPIEQVLELNLEPGEYYYRCDAHPTTMEGILTVE